ncbi:MAG TPA: POTRA domain-containing protein, partial [Acidobacteriaceae bacterium]|nr:POTRA domain-containing protein [Acidobacteriaceae bacterium]
MLLLAAALLPALPSAAPAQSPSTVNSQAAGQAAQPQSSTNPNAPIGTPQASQDPRSQKTIGNDSGSGPTVVNPLPPLSTSLWSQRGTPVEAIRFQGVNFASGDAIFADLTQKSGQPLDPEKVRADLRRLFASGRYRNISVTAERGATGLTLVYAGVPRYYVGRVEIHGVNQERLTSLLAFATKLEPGTPFSEPDIPAAIQGVQLSLQQNGYYGADVQVATTRDDVNHQVNAIFTVRQGPQARVGQVALQGKDPGITVPDFRKKGKLDCGRISTAFDKLIRRDCRVKVTRETSGNALSGVRGYYQKKEHLEGTISLQSQTYAPPREELDYGFLANQGPVVHVTIDGTKVSDSRKKLLVPVYEEGAVDRDLLNEGAFNIRDFLQRKGYFDAQDSVKLLGEGTDNVTVQYIVDPGRRHKVRSVRLTGNKYFSNDLIEQRLRVKGADLYVRSGTYSTQLVDADRSSIEALYRASGFTHVKVTSAVKDTDNGSEGKPLKV